MISTNKIAVLDGFPINPGDLSWSPVEKLGECKIYSRTSPDEIPGRCKEVQIALTNKVVFSKTIIENLPDLKYIGVLATGYNVVDTEAAAKAGIVVANIPAYSTKSVAQMVFAHILNFTQQVALHSQSVRDGQWENCSDFSYQLTPQTEIAGKTIGIVGFGKIGQAVAKIALAFGMNVIFQNPNDKSGILAETRQVSLKTLFAESDFVSINCPLDSGNKAFVNKTLLGLAKPSVFIVNTGRGLLLNESDVAEALNTGRIGGLGADVLSTEPPEPGNPLLKARNCFITPHIAWATKEARERLIKIAASNIEAFLNGNPVNTVV